ncbi:hypothetical protein [Streptomyces sp. NPDC059819]|uniref:hypothetical protein n=1 Tax=Streptomyces sp. NPDC059819 TaxID=3346963 RepID=UPI003661FA82
MIVNPSTRSFFTSGYVLVWTRLAASPRYQSLRLSATDAYAAVPPVRDMIRSMVSDAAAPGADKPPPSEAIEANAPYVLAETPILVDAPRSSGTTPPSSPTTSTCPCTNCSPQAWCPP